MQLIYEFVSYRELSQAERILLACGGVDFTFIRYNGVLKINKALPEPKTLVKIAQAMWQIDHLMDEQDSEQMDKLWCQVKQIIGEDGAMQLYEAWNKALHEKLDAEDKRDAKAWLDARNIPDELDSIADGVGTYRPGFIKALWGASGRSTDAIFLYGYQMGMEAARKAV